MLSSFALTLLLAAPQALPAESFPARVLRGKLMEAASDGPAYQKLLWPQITAPVTALLKTCIDTNAPADKSPFTVVAELSPEGTPSQIEAQPATPVAQCFASGFGKITLPAPPKLADAATYPIEIDVSIVP